MTDTTTPIVTISPETALGDLVNQHPSLARPLQGLGLDYCCGGAQTLATAATEKGLDPTEVAAHLTELATATADEPAPWADLDARALVDHVETTHHQFLWNELPRVGALVDKIVEVHGNRHPELASVQSTFVELRQDLEPHLRKEELMLFPAIRALAADEAPPAFPFGSVRNPISVMMSDHDRAGELLETLRARTGGYEPPADGCATYRAAYEGLAEIEADTHLHVHKENNLLFPMVITLEAAFEAQGTERIGTMADACHTEGVADDACAVDGVDVCHHDET